jgi:hypothetical protein
VDISDILARPGFKRAIRKENNNDLTAFLLLETAYIIKKK